MITHPKSKRRTQELALIHAGAKALGIDRETYERMLFTVARVMSAAELDEHGRKRVIEHLRTLGFGGGRNQGAPHNLKQNPLLRKIGALLAHGKKPWRYADAMAKRMCNKERVAFCDDSELLKLVQALQIDANRKAVKS